MYQKAGLATAGVRVITRSKSRAEAALESRHRCPEVPEGRHSSVHVAISLEPASTPDVQPSSAQTSLLPSLGTATAKQKPKKHTQSVAVHGCSKLPGTSTVRVTAVTAYHDGTTLAASLLHQPSDDLEQLDTAVASSKLIHPSLLQHPGMSCTGQAAAHMAAAGQAHHYAACPASRASRAAAKQPASPSNSTDDSSRDSGSSFQRQPSRRRVSFAPGPLCPQLHNNCTSDGHPATEGAQVFPVRRLAPGYALDLTKGNV